LPDIESKEKGISVILKEDIRWKRCDIKSIALLPNTLSFQEAYSKGMKECIFVRDGKITECSHSNVFFVMNGELHTHPESNLILSGITRKNIVRIARETGLKVVEEGLSEDRLDYVEEAFISNTSSEVTPVIEINGKPVGNGIPGPVTRLLQEKFDSETISLKRLDS
jgi:D-alanine transaminase